MCPETIDLGKWTEAGLDELLRTASAMPDAGERIELLSEQFLGTPYAENTLAGQRDTPEALVISLGGVDCFTFIDYVEAMRRSSCFAEFRGNLKTVRYRKGIVAFEDRNHFFTDWPEVAPGLFEDITGRISPGRARSVSKTLNRRANGGLFVEGVAPVVREVRYLPPEGLDDEAWAKLATGDYAGIYSAEDGLDVSHVGIVIRSAGGLLFRHASSRAAVRRVLDEDLVSYLARTLGLVVLRPLG